MDKKLFIVVLDTTESTTRRSVGLGLLNTYVVYATDVLHARQIVLRIFRPEVAEQVRSSLYVYSVDDIGPNLQDIDKRNGLPFWSYLPLNGARPPRQNETADVSTTSGNKTLDQSIVPTPQQVAPARQPTTVPKPDPMVRVPVGRSQVGSRSKEFHEGDDARPTVSDNLNKDQAALIRSLGVVKTNEGQDEGVNNRINSSTGVNNNLTRQQSLPPTPNTMKPDQAQLLAKLGVGLPQEKLDPEFDADVVDSKLIYEDPSLAQIDNAVLSDAELKKLQSELDEHK